ncbi:hypothetical protein [Achromobacter sp.]|uniref:hypothetical protein n=1 Tax=Achromobacter sp. TaxID=134375 RepID=UPI0028AA1C04|nr:hypothetical protein [Achromobacter sp.]
MLIIPALKCLGSGHDFYAYNGTSPPDVDGKTACPVCGKPVKLRPDSLGFRRFIPNHHGDAAPTQ